MKVGTAYLTEYLICCLFTLQITIFGFVHCITGLGDATCSEKKKYSTRGHISFETCLYSLSKMRFTVPAFFNLSLAGAENVWEKIIRPSSSSS